MQIKSHSWPLASTDVLDNRVAGLGGNSTVVVAVSAHHDVAFHSPTGTPAAKEKKGYIITII